MLGATKSEPNSVLIVSVATTTFPQRSATQKWLVPASLGAATSVLLVP